MRDPARIKPILKIIEDIWVQNPDMRLGQLLSNASVSYYSEDLTHLIQGLHAVYGSTPLLWGTYGKNGDEEIKYLRLDEMSNEHISRILELENIQIWLKELLTNELTKRNETKSNI